MGSTILSIFVFVGAILLVIKNYIELSKEGTGESRTKALKFSNIMLVIGIVTYILTFLINHL